MSLIILALNLLAACSSQNPINTSTTLALQPTLEIPRERSTLPPTWTATFTDTPAPATDTRTPEPASPIPTSAPTLAPQEICAGLTVQNSLDDGDYFPWDGTIGMGIGTEAPNVIVRFVAVHRLTGENKGFQVPGGGVYLVNFNINLLPRPGLYDWTLSVISEAYGELCTRGGYFIVGRPGWVEGDTDEDTPEATEADNPDS